MNGSRIRGRGNWRLGFLGQPIRAKRAKLKSCKDDEIIAQGKRGTNAALGSERKMICSPFSGLARQPAGVPNLKKGRVGTGWALPRAAAYAALPWATILLPLRGAGPEKLRLGKTNQPSQNHLRPL